MAQITYVGAADVKRFTKADFAKVDIEHDAVHFDAGNDFTAEVSDEVWTWLNSDASTEKGQFKLTEEADASDASEESAPSGAGEGPGPDAPSAGTDPVAPGGTPTSETGTDRAKAGGTTRGSTRGT